MTDETDGIERSDAGNPADMTVVFRMDVRAIKGNPFLLDTPFGRPVTIGIGDAFEQADDLREEVEGLRQALRAAKVLIAVSVVPDLGPEAKAAWSSRMAEIDAALGEGAAQPHRKKDGAWPTS